ARAGLKYRRHSFIFDQMGSQQTAFPQFLINDHKVESEADMLAYIARIDGSARALKQLLVRAQLAAKEGIRPPLFSYTVIIDESKKVIAGAPFEPSASVDAALWADAKSKIAALQDQGLVSKTRAEALTAATRDALRGSFRGSYLSLIAWMEKDLPNADVEPRGAHALPDGQDFYAYRLASYTSGTKTAEEIHSIGLAEVARIRVEMEAIMKQTGFEGDLSQFLAFVRDDKQFYYSNDDKGREEYITETRRLMDLTRQRLPQYFGLLPIAALEVKRVEAFRERDGGAAHYRGGRPDGSKPGIYYLHLSDMSAMNTVTMQSTAYHEGVPGHHMQISIALENKTLPVFRTNVSYSSYTEGWALYSELVAKEMGVYDDLYYDFGRLVDEIWRAIRLVVDTGMHSKGWSEQQAVDYFMANVSVPEVKVRSEVQRYLVWPGQATSYKMGMLNILELRRSARETLGDKFDIRSFHDVILGGGSLPQEILERRVNDWIQSQEV
ncbi:MAG: DUF885 domain-containing protein, partial [Proteobacteria bacterium]|nr:DUF885 domain-containing protein [Pseudomonadota bacterium]